MSIDGPPQMRKFLSTQHLAGSGLQRGEDDVRAPLSVLRTGGEVVYEEKVDGANSAFRFDAGGNLLLQCRGHYLDAANRNAPRERDWGYLKDWMTLHQGDFLDRFEDRYVVYGECPSIAHSCFYDRLPGIFLEFDILDLANGEYLDTDARRALCRGLPIMSVPVLYRGQALSDLDMRGLVGPSVFATPLAEPAVGAAAWGETLAATGSWDEALRRACKLVGDDPERRLAKLDRSGMAEGLYIKVEQEGRVTGRYKWVRPGFVQVMLDANEHWQSRFPVPNLLAAPLAGLPHYLAQATEPPAVYDPDRPWEWGPWTPANPAVAPPFRPR